MHSRVLTQWIAAWLVAAAVSSGVGASHKDWTAIPLGSFLLSEGTQTIQVARPYDRFGVIASPIVFTAVFDPSQPLGSPAEIGFAQDERQLPTWTVRRLGQMYVIGVEPQEQAAGASERSQRNVLTLQVSVKNAAAGLVLMASGTPDFGLLGADALGPLEDLVERLDRGAAREYFNATIGITAGRLQLAQADFTRLARGSDQQLGRFARAALRRLRFAEAAAGPQTGFHAHYRLGLYAQQCGMFRNARLHLDAALQSLDTATPRPTDWQISDAWYRLGEMMERCGDPIDSVAAVMERAGGAARVTPNVWDVWVTILLSKEYEEEREGKKVPVRVEMTPQQIEKIKREWHWVEQMVYGASGGHFKLNTRFVEIPDTSAVPYGLNVGWLYGPLDELVPLRGSVDCVMSFHPRGPSVTGGADCGPNGAAMTDIGTWCGWEVYLHEWNHQFDWTVRTSEAGDGYPITHHSDSCGHQPIPSMGYGHRASMRYYVTPAMYRRLEPADPDNGQGYIRNWRVGPPVAIIAAAAPSPEPPPHQAAKLRPSMAASIARRFIAIRGNFLDLKAIFDEPEATLPDWRMGPATAYVLSPARQEVRLWLGHNDGMAVWINDELIHRGDYYAIAKFEDQNWPNMLATAAVLQKGWNRIDVVVESWPAPRNKGYGFSVRICDFENRPVEGLVVANEKTEVPDKLVPDPFRPTIGKHYRWDEVSDDFYHRLPKLTDFATNEDQTFRWIGGIGATHGFVAMGLDADRTGEARGGIVLRALPKTWDRATDRDTQLNNVLDWNREAVAVYPVGLEADPTPGGSNEPQRHYLLMRPEAVEAYLTCLREAPEARKHYSGRPVRDRILGYVQVGRMEDEAEGVRVLIVAEACLPTPLPVDEEDLLSPLPE